MAVGFLQREPNDEPPEVRRPSERTSAKRAKRAGRENESGKTCRASEASEAFEHPQGPPGTLRTPAGATTGRFASEACALNVHFLFVQSARCARNSSCDGSPVRTPVGATILHMRTLLAPRSLGGGICSLNNFWWPLWGVRSFRFAA